MDYFVSVLWMRRKELTEWGEKKEKVQTFFLGEDFDVSVKLIVEFVRKKYATAKNIRVNGLNEDILEIIVRNAVKQKIISAIAQEYIKYSFEGKEWSEVEKLTLSSKRWLTQTIGKCAEGIKSSIDGKISLAKTDKKCEVHISNCNIVEADTVKRSRATYSAEKLLQWAEMEGIFGRIQNFNKNVVAAHEDSKKYCFEKGFSSSDFEETWDRNVFFQKVKKHISRKLGEIYAEAKINGGDWDEICSKKLSDDEWIKVQIDLIVESVKERIDKALRISSLDDGGYCFGDCYSGSGNAIAPDDDYDIINSI